MAAFDIIKADIRTASMIGWFSGICKKVTDFLPGSIIRSKFEAIAVEMEEQDFAFYTALKKAIPVAAYTVFDFSLQDATQATGLATFGTATPAATDIPIAAGTQVAVPATTTETEKVYETTASATLLAGQSSVTVAIRAKDAGAAGNTGAGTITSLKSAIPGITTVTNSAKLDNGKDQETEPERKKRFKAYVRTLTMGTDDALVYGATTTQLVDVNGIITEQVVYAAVTGPPDTGAAGACSIYIFNGVDGASADLIAACQKIIDGDRATRTPGYKAAGVVATVQAVTVIAQDVNMTITPSSGYNPAVLTAKAEVAAAAFIMGMIEGADSFVVAAMIERIMKIPGIYNMTLTTPAADVPLDPTTVMIPGTITVTAA